MYIRRYYVHALAIIWAFLHKVQIIILYDSNQLYICMNYCLVFYNVVRTYITGVPVMVPGVRIYSNTIIVSVMEPMSPSH